MDNKALATTEKSGGIMDMNSGMSGEMAARLGEMKNSLSMVKDFMNDIMDDGFDYGLIPGVEKKCLFKPGAEKLLMVYGFTSLVKEKKENRDLRTGYYLAEITIQIVHRSSGAIIAEGVGECSTYETKYRYRWLYEKELPNGTDKTGLVCKKWTGMKDGKPVEYARYRMDNTDLVDQWNTVLKMAKKRALVDATLTATGTSSIFNQTIDEMDDFLDGDAGRLRKLKKQKSAPSPADEKSTFNPSASGSGVITLAQKNKIQYDAEKKNVKLEDMEAIILHTKQKPMAELTKAEASAVIEWLSKATEDDLQGLVIDIAMEGDK